MSTQNDLLAEIEAFLRDRRMAETTFGRLAVNDGKFVGRLRSGANMTLSTIDRVRSYMRAASPVPVHEAPSSPLAADDNASPQPEAA